MSTNMNLHYLFITGVCGCMPVITSLTLPLFIEVPVLRQENERLCICVLEASIFPLSTIFLLDYGNFSYLLFSCDHKTFMTYGHSHV